MFIYILLKLVLIITEIICDEPLVIKDAVQTAKHGFRYKSVVQYKCNDDWRTEDGSPTKNITCESGGWTEDSFTCAGEWVMFLILKRTKNLAFGVVYKSKNIKQCVLLQIIDALLYQSWPMQRQTQLWLCME